MTRVVLVDDENIVRIGLASMLDWKANGYELVGMFADGGEAMAYCMEHPPHIVLTDVEMPRVDGLDFIAMLRESLPGVAVVVLSNHDKFEYVSSTFKNGVADYLLKAFIEPKQLLETLNRIRDSLPGGAQSEADDDATPAVNDFFRGLMDQEQAGELLSALERRHPEQAAHVLCMRLMGEQIPARRLLRSSVKNALEKYCAAYVTVQTSLADMLLLGALEEERMNDICRDLAERMTNLFAIPVVIGWAGPGRVSNLPALTRQARETLRFTAFLNRENRRALSWRSLREDKPLEGEFLALMGAQEERHDPMSFESGIAHVSSLLSALDTERYVPLAAVENGVNAYLFQTASLLCEKYGIAPEEARRLRRQHERPALDGFPAAADYLRRAASLAQEARRWSSQCGAESRLHSRVKKYIREHLDEDLSVERLSALFSLSGKHLSHEFKRTTGVNLSQYVAEARIARARELLAHTELSTELISERCGFATPNYFVRVFKKTTGMTLSEYKSSMRNADG